MTRDYGSFLETAIGSVLAQDLAEWELFICDDASTDETSTLVRRFLSDPRIRYVRHPTALGQAGNWSFCLDLGTAPYVAVLHADDAYLPNALRAAVNALDRDEEIDLFYGNCVRFRRIVRDAAASRYSLRIPWAVEDGKLAGSEAYMHMIETNHALPSTSFLRRSVLDRSGRPDSDLAMTVDGEFLRRVALASRLVAWSCAAVTLYREHSESTSSKSVKSGRFAEELQAFDRIACRNISAAGLRAKLSNRAWWWSRHKSNQKQAAGLLRLAICAALDGEHTTAKDLLKRSLKMAPTLLFMPNVFLHATMIGANQNVLLRMIHAAHRNRKHVVDHIECGETQLVSNVSNFLRVSRGPHAKQ